MKNKTNPMRTLALMLTMVAAPAVAHAQIPVGTRVGAPPASGYDDGGRRDPFVSLVPPKKVPGSTSQTRPASGLAAVAVSDVSVTGSIAAGASFIALLQGPDGRSYTAKSGDRLQDAGIKRIERDAVVFVQQVEDLLGVPHPKEIRKTIRPEGAGR